MDISSSFGAYEAKGLGEAVRILRAAHSNPAGTVEMLARVQKELQRQCLGMESMGQALGEALGLLPPVKPKGERWTTD